MRTSHILPILVLATSSGFAQVPDSGTRHDRRSSYLELGLSANVGFPDLFRPQIEVMAKHRGWPIFLSGRMGLAIGDWIGEPTVLATPQLALHWTRDGDDSWALRLGWVMGEHMFPIGSNARCDSGSSSCGYLDSKLLGNTLALERTAYFPGSRDFAWRASLGVASAWHQFEDHGSPVVGSRTSSVMPFLDIGLVWTSF